MIMKEYMFWFLNDDEEMFTLRGFIIIVTRYVRLDTPPVILSSGSTLDLGSKSGCTVRHGASDEVGPDPSEHRPPDEIRWFNVHPEQICHAAADSLKSRCITLRWKGCSRDKAERLSVQINLQWECFKITFRKGHQTWWTSLIYSSIHIIFS